MDSDLQELAGRARAVLDDNWTGAATRPGPGLYPHQWSWDAGFVAIGYAHYHQARAETELRSLFQGQWSNGLLPHIVFSSEDSGYFPGPEFWQTRRSRHAPERPRTSGIVQPPIHATAALHVYRFARDESRARAFLEDLYPRLEAWHDYLYRERDPAGEELVAIRHPWESGQDNSPIWDAVYGGIAFRPEDVPPYRRADLGVADQADRPEDRDYDRYVYLLGLFRERDWAEARIRAETPFMVQDALFNSLLVQSERDLGEMARLLGESGERFTARASRTARRMNEKLWHGEHGTYFDYDLRAEACIHAHSATGTVPLFAGVPDQERAASILAYLNRCGFCPLEEDCWAVPSYDREADGFDPRRYWRGPIWININWLLLRGLLRYGFEEYADKIRRAVVELPRRSGFFEYYDPETLEGRGSDRFSWTAALLLDVLAEDLGVDVAERSQSQGADSRHPPNRSPFGA